jgi:alpha-glucosidase
VSGPPTDRDPPWWRSGLLYQVYVRSFADSNGDGVGDLPGILAHLDHLVALGIDGLWLSPVTVSPNADWGYDVADYCDVDPELGTLADLDALVEACGRVGIRVLLDLVPNHTSDRHPWFVDARRGRDAAHRDDYVWADPGRDGAPPNNWVSAFGGPAWTLDEASGQYYLHNFLPEQPDLNWWNPSVREAFEEIERFWFDRGVAGFRIDVCHMIVKDALLRDNPPATAEDPFIVQVFGQRSVYNANRPEVHDVLRSWRRLADTYDPPRLLLGETNVEDLATLVRYYGTGSDELQLGFNFPFLEAPFEADALSMVVETTESLLPPGAWPVWTGSNHDVSRLATRWAGGDAAKTRLAILMLLTLRGTPVLYQGDEIGLTDTVLEHGDLLDPVGLRYWPAYAGRDPVRTPMPWANEPGAGFCAAGVRPWLPFGDLAACNVADQVTDPGSTLAFTRDLIALRRRSPALATGARTALGAPAGVWRWQRGADTEVVLNLSDAVASVADAHGRILISTDRARDEEPVRGTVSLGAWEGVVVQAETADDGGPAA